MSAMLAARSPPAGSGRAGEDANRTALRRQGARLYAAAVAVATLPGPMLFVGSVAFWAILAALVFSIVRWPSVATPTRISWLSACLLQLFLIVLVLSGVFVWTDTFAVVAARLHEAAGHMLGVGVWLLLVWWCAAWLALRWRGPDVSKSGLPWRCLVLGMVLALLALFTGYLFADARSPFAEGVGPHTRLRFGLLHGVAVPGALAVVVHRWLLYSRRVSTVSSPAPP